MGFLDSVFNAAKSGMDKLCVQQFNEYRSRPTDLLERQARAADNNGARRLFILAIASKLPYSVIKKLNEFDFTKRNPKVIFITTKNRLLTASEVIYLVLLYYIGFDVLIFAPNGISNIEYLLNKNIIQVHELGEYDGNTKIPIFNLLF